MGWFDSFLADGGWVGPAILGGAMLYSSQQSAAANLAAAQIAADSQRRQAEAIREGNALAQQRFMAAQEQAAPSVARMQQMAAADPHGLSQQQQAQVDDARRTTMSALQVSGLRGSGRAAVAAVRRAEDNTRGRLVEENQRRADSANTSLASQYFGAGQQAAALDANAGQAIGRGIEAEGALGANAMLANTALNARALGDVAAVTADALKEGRRSYYRDNRPSEGG